MESMNKKLIVILGPNASGKSNLGVSLAKKIDGEIVSADSRQVYKGLDIGSGKITKKEMNGVKHYCLDIANPKKIFTAHDYKKCAEEATQKIWQKNKIPIIVGGTGVYIDSAVGRVELSNVPLNPRLRKRLQKLSTAQLFNKLKKLDPKKAKNIDRNNKVRLERAIEIVKGERLVFSKSFRSTEKGVQPENILWIGIKRSKEDLKKRIHKRLVVRIPGIIKEIKKLRHPPAGGGITWKRLFELGLEYRYVSLYLRGQLKKGDMIKKLETEINRYAKRQMTYWRRNKEIKWVGEKEAKKLGQRFALA